eukprot:5600551-Pleurochrysis_carterae.AAC.1
MCPCNKKGPSERRSPSIPQGKSAPEWALPPDKQVEIAARGAEPVVSRREAERAHSAGVSRERVQQRLRAQVEHVHAVVGAARK